MDYPDNPPASANPDTEQDAIMATYHQRSLPSELTVAKSATDVFVCASGLGLGGCREAEDGDNVFRREDTRYDCELKPSSSITIVRDAVRELLNISP